jgi:hypothetical protein
LIASQLIGFALMRYVWKIEPIASMSDDEIVAALVPLERNHPAPAPTTDRSVTTPPRTGVHDATHQPRRTHGVSAWSGLHGI